MAERTEAEKAQDSYEKRLKEQELQYHREREQLVAHHREIHAFHEEQNKELIAQNDAMLGAIGRVHSENEALRKRISELEPALVKVSDELSRIQRDHAVFLEEANDRCREAVENAKREADHEIQRLKDKLASVQARKKK